MKKIITILVAALCFAAVASAQPRAIGLRATYGAELSYQHTLGEKNFLEADLGWVGKTGFNIAATYNFIVGSAGNFNFYVGPGLDFNLPINTSNDNKTNLGIAGMMGAEYNFSFPLSLSLDWRPVFFLFGNGGFGWQSIALGIRYRF